MVIKNETKKTTLSESAVFAKTFKQKAFGLLLAGKTDAMIFQTRFGIHTFFMKYPIDVLVLDEDNKIAVLKKKLKQNRIFVWNPKYNTVIELSEGIIEKTQTTYADTVLLL